MSSLIERLNAIKTACTLEWLTPSQAQAWGKLQQYLSLNEVINLYGPPGSGKTFIAWLLVKQGVATYIPKVEDLIGDTAHILAIPVIDNMPSTRDTYRTLLKYLSFQKQRQAIALSQTAIPDDCYRVSLSCTEQDKDHIYQQLQSIDHTMYVRDGGTLHHVVNPDLPVITFGSTL
jgi:hypothetical protein